MKRLKRRMLTWSEKVDITPESAALTMTPRSTVRSSRLSSTRKNDEVCCSSSSTSAAYKQSFHPGSHTDIPSSQADQLSEADRTTGRKRIGRRKKIEILQPAKKCTNGKQTLEAQPTEAQGASADAEPRPETSIHSLEEMESNHRVVALTSSLRRPVPPRQQSHYHVSVSEIEDAAARCTIPKHFDRIWTGLLEMRSDRSAPVDTMGCSRLGDQDEDPKVTRFHHLVACLLSSQTTDQANANCMKRLKTIGLTVENIRSTPEGELASLMFGISFHNTKAKNLKRICDILERDYGGDIPSTFDALCALPGIGPKMALLTLSAAWDRVDGIAVDVHVHRISNRLGLIKTKTPEESCIALAGAIPRDVWEQFNEVLVGFGQQRCKALRPECSTCLVFDFCSYPKKESFRSPNKC